MKRTFTKYPSGYVKASNVEDDMMYTVYDGVIDRIHDVYDKAKQFPQPDTYSVGGTYYGGTELHDVHGNDLELIENGTCYENGRKYEGVWAIKIGGAYNIYDIDFTKELRKFLKDNREELRDSNLYVIEVNGWGYSLYGIADRVS